MKKQAYHAVRVHSWRFCALATLLIATAIYIFMNSSFPYVSKFIRGGTPFSAEALENHADAEPVNFASVTGQSMVDAKSRLVTQPLAVLSYVEYFGVLTVGNRLLLIQSSTPINETQLNYRGTLARTNPDTITARVDTILQQQPEIKSAFLEYTLILDGATQNWNWGVGLLILLGVVLGGIYLITVAVERWFNPTLHPIIQALTRFDIDLETLFNQVDADIAMSSEKHGSITLSKNWVIYKYGGSFNLIRVADVIWAYKSIERHTAYYIIPIWKNVFVMVHDEYGDVIKAQMWREKQCDKFLGMLMQRAPKAMFGYR